MCVLNKLVFLKIIKIFKKYFKEFVYIDIVYIDNYYLKEKYNLMFVFMSFLFLWHTFFPFIQIIRELLTKL